MSDSPFATKGVPGPVDGQTDERVHVAGIDGAPNGWVIVVVDPESGCTVDVRVVDTDAIVDLVRRGIVAAAAIDMPIGMPVRGTRECDVEARRRLGVRRDSIFATPIRAVVGAATWADANARSRAVDGRGLSRQSFGLVEKIASLDAVIEPGDQRSLVEASPELSFAVMTGAPMRHYKLTSEGRAERLAALSRWSPDVGDVVRAVTRRGAGTRMVDVIDAYAVAWTAARVWRGEAVRLGGGVDERGLCMQIVV
jgi:predicted RNase H-like nuclease